MKQSSKFGAIFALMLVLFIGGMGQGIIFPILTNTITNPHSVLFFHDASDSTRQFWYGMLVGIYYLMWFISAPILGDWSDSIGRKKALLICLSLAAVSFLLAALAFDLDSLFILFIARFLGGVTSGDQAIAKAAVIDVCPQNKKPIYIGLILGSVTLGLVTGPLIGAILQDSALNPWFNIKVPFYFALLLSVINIFLIKRYFSERKFSHRIKKIKWLQSVALFTKAFFYKEIRLLLLSYCLTQMAWQTFYIYTPAFVTAKFHMSATQASSILALIGIGIGIGLSALPYLFNKINHKSVAICGYSVLFVGNLLFALANKPVYLWLSIIPMASLFGLAAVNVLSLFSNNTSKDQQGWMMGITGSVVALTGAIGALIAGCLSSINISMPYLFSLVTLLIGILLLNAYNTKTTDSAKNRL